MSNKRSLDLVKILSKILVILYEFNFHRKGAVVNLYYNNRAIKTINFASILYNLVDISEIVFATFFYIDFINRNRKTIL